MEKHQKSLVWMIAILVIFFLNLTLLIISFVFVLHGDEVAGIVRFYVTYHIHFMILLGLLGIAVGVISYYGFTSQRKDMQRSVQVSKDILLKFLDNGERLAVNYLLNHPDEVVTQANISRLEQMGKVKAHRTIQRLEDKKIIILTPHGKTKRIEFHEDINKLFAKE